MKPLFRHDPFSIRPDYIVSPLPHCDSSPGTHNNVLASEEPALWKVVYGSIPEFFTTLLPVCQDIYTGSSADHHIHLLF